MNTLAAPEQAYVRAPLYQPHAPLLLPPFAAPPQHPPTRTKLRTLPYGTENTRHQPFGQSVIEIVSQFVSQPVSLSDLTSWQGAEGPLGRT